METDESDRVVPFQLQFDKPAPSQRLWTITPGKCITSLCWRPDGKAVAVGLEDGTISLHDVEVALSKDFCRLIIICSGEISSSSNDFHYGPVPGNKTEGMHCLVLDTSIFRKRKQELHQVAQQASSIEDLTEVIRASLSIMYKQWCDAMQIFHDKFHSLSTLIVDHGLDSSPQEEFLSLLGGARTSPPVHQFLVNSLGELGLKRVMKAVSNAGNELQLILLDHIQPAAEIIAFRMGELRGLSRWRSRYAAIGLDEELIENATEKVGMLLLQVVRFVQILSSVSQQDPVKLLLDQSVVDHYVQLDLDTTLRVEELVKLGGFADTECLHRTLAKEFHYMESSFKEAFNMPYTTISKEIICEQMLPLYSFQSSPPLTHCSISTSISFYWDAVPEISACETNQENLVDYITFQIPEWSSSDVLNCICILWGVINGADNIRNRYTTVEALLLSVSKDFSCMDLSLYKERQIVLLLNETTASSDSSGNARLMMVPTSDLPFVSISRSTSLKFWNFDQLQDFILPLQMESAKVQVYLTTWFHHLQLAHPEVWVVYLLLESEPWSTFSTKMKKKNQPQIWIEILDDPGVHRHLVLKM